jgi:predicted transcriptional regulator of viral defense system
MGKLKTIYLALLNRKDKIVRKEEIIEVIEEYNKKLNKVSVKDALWYLSRRHYIRRIFLDYYYINSIEEREMHICNYEDKEVLFEVLNKKGIKWYIGLTSALYASGDIWQIPNVLTIINNKISGKRAIFGLKLNFIKIKESLIFGLVNKKTKNNIRYSYSDTQKTNLDLAYLIKHNNLSKDKKTREYLKKYPKWLQK